MYATPKTVENVKKLENFMKGNRPRIDQNEIQRTSEDQQETKMLLEPSKMEQKISSNRQSKSIITCEEARNSYSFWPEGTESWHIHKFKPQRKIFIRNLLKDLIVKAQCETSKHESKTIKKLSDAETDSLPFDTICQFDDGNDLSSEYMRDSSIKQCEHEVNNSQNVTKSLQLLPPIPLMKKQEQRSCLQIPKTRTAQPRFKLLPDQLHLNWKSRFYNRLSASDLSMRLSLSHYSYGLLLQFINRWVIQYSLFLCAILLRIGITYKPMDSPNTIYDLSPTFDLELSSNISTISLKQYFKKIVSNTKTIEILRDLEALLIYASI